jgi:hypothetical protein
MQRSKSENMSGKQKTVRRKTAPFRHAVALVSALALGNGIGDMVSVPLPGTKQVFVRHHSDGESSKRTCMDYMPAKLWADRNRKEQKE